MKTLTPAEAARLIADGATLVDIRGHDEHLRERIAEAVHCPLEALDEAELGDGILIFHCRSGNRTALNAGQLAGKGREAYALAGGIDAWRGAGLPTLKDRARPIELMRQVQIGAGALALAGTLLGLAVSAWFLAVPAFVGAGLTIAGITGFCGMARLLALAPWNRALRGA